MASVIVWAFVVLMAMSMSYSMVKVNRAINAAKVRQALASGKEPGKDLALIEEPEPIYELFGHPAPPLPLLQASVPLPGARWLAQQRPRRPDRRGGRIQR